jgi:ABC-2 type transport system permease protein
MRKYLAYTSIALREGIAFRINLFTSMFGGLFRLVLLSSVWRAVYVGQGELAGYRESEILVYVVISSAMSAGGLLGVGRELGSKVNTGDIVLDLIRPVLMPWRFFFFSFGRFSFQLWIKGVPTLLFGFLIVGLTPSVNWGILASFVLLWIGGSFLHFWLEFGVASFAFRTRSPYGIGVLWNAASGFLTGLVVPITFYPDLLHKIVSWTPFPSVAYTPIRVLMGQQVIYGGLARVYQSVFSTAPMTALVMEQASWILIVVFIASRIYRWNEKALDIHGG